MVFGGDSLLAIGFDDAELCGVIDGECGVWCAVQCIGGCCGVVFSDDDCFL